jgi:hypothetical protein
MFHNAPSRDDASRRTGEAPPEKNGDDNQNDDPEGVGHERSVAYPFIKNREPAIRTPTSAILDRRRSPRSETLK